MFRPAVIVRPVSEFPVVPETCAGFVWCALCGVKCVADEISNRLVKNGAIGFCPGCMYRASLQIGVWNSRN
jgi:hypothetical protein